MISYCIVSGINQDNPMQICKLKSCKYYSYSTTGDEEEIKNCRDWVEKWEKYQSIYPYVAIDARYRKVEINEH